GVRGDAGALVELGPAAEVGREGVGQLGDDPFGAAGGDPAGGGGDVQQVDGGHARASFTTGAAGVVPRAGSGRSSRVQHLTEPPPLSSSDRSMPTGSKPRS